VARSGADRGAQWPGSQVISAQKANTANAFSLTGFAISTANLWAATQLGGSLFGLQLSNPVDTALAYANKGHGGGNAKKYGLEKDPMVKSFIGGVNVFGGEASTLRFEWGPPGALGALGALGVSETLSVGIITSRGECVIPSASTMFREVLGGLRWERRGQHYL